MGDGIVISLIPRTKRQEGEIDVTSSVPKYYYSLVVGDLNRRDPGALFGAEGCPKGLA